MIMSSGSLTAVETAIRFPIRLVESGPAGGAILGQHLAKELGAPQAIALDMGGTTAKIILLNDYEPRHSRSMEVARVCRFLPGSGPAVARAGDRHDRDRRRWRLDRRAR